MVDIFLRASETSTDFSTPNKPVVWPKGLAARRIDALTNDELQKLNLLLPWAAMTSDSRGRVVGSAWSPKKRNLVHSFVDRHHTAFNDRLPMADQHILEIGCFEGVHTIGCLLLGAQVTAVDGRIENIVKTLTRLWAYELSANVLLWDVEREPPTLVPDSWDILHHIGVLYHQTNPVEHLRTVLPRTRRGVLLDTHVAFDEASATESYEVAGKPYRYAHYREKDIHVNPFSGMLDHAKWLLSEDLHAICREFGFTDVRTVEDHEERNGRRVTIWAFR
jgi:hypothetical protein